MQGVERATDQEGSWCSSWPLRPFLIPALDPCLGLQTVSCHPGLGSGLLSGPTTTLHLGCASPKNRWTDGGDGEHHPAYMYVSLSL